MKRLRFWLLYLAGIIAAMLLAFLGTVALIDWLAGRYVG